MVGGRNYVAAVASLFDGRCDVIVRTHDTDEASGRAVTVEKTVMRDEPCRISFRAVSPAARVSVGARATQEITLFIARDVTIPAGSKIVVTQNGVRGVYAQAGEPAVYSSHREVPLKLFERWA